MGHSISKQEGVEPDLSDFALVQIYQTFVSVKARSRSIWRNSKQFSRKRDLQVSVRNSVKKRTLVKISFSYRRLLSQWNLVRLPHSQRHCAHQDIDLNCIAFTINGIFTTQCKKSPKKVATLRAMIKSIRGSICYILVLGKSTQAEYFRVYSAPFGFCSISTVRPGKVIKMALSLKKSQLSSEVLTVSDG